MVLTDALKCADGDQTYRLAALRQRSGRVVHRRRSYRPALSSTRPCACRCCQRHLRAGSAHSLAYSPPRTDPDRDRRQWMGSATRWCYRGDSPRRCGLARAWGEALARGNAHHGYDPHRNSGTIRRGGRELDGARQRRSVSAVSRLKQGHRPHSPCSPPFR